MDALESADARQCAACRYEKFMPAGDTICRPCQDEIGKTLRSARPPQPSPQCRRCGGTLSHPSQTCACQWLCPVPKLMAGREALELLHERRLIPGDPEDCLTWLRRRYLPPLS